VPEPAVCWLAVLQPNGLQLDLLQFDALLLFVLQCAGLPLAGNLQKNYYVKAIKFVVVIQTVVKQ